MLPRGLFALLLPAIALGAPTARSAPSTPAVAKQAANVFIARMQARDAAGAAGLCDAPFINHEQRVLGTTAEVKAYLTTMSSQVAPEVQSNTVIAVSNYEDTRAGTDKAIVAVRDKLLRPNGYVVYVGRGAQRWGFLLVRIIQGKARVVGIG